MDYELFSQNVEEAILSGFKFNFDWTKRKHAL